MAVPTTCTVKLTPPGHVTGMQPTLSDIGDEPAGTVTGPGAGREAPVVQSTNAGNPLIATSRSTELGLLRLSVTATGPAVNVVELRTSSHVTLIGTIVT